MVMDLKQTAATVKKDSRRENLRLCRNAQKEMQRLLDYKGFHAAWGLVTCNKVNEPLVSTCDILWFCVDLWVRAAVNNGRGKKWVLLFLGGLLDTKWLDRMATMNRKLNDWNHPPKTRTMMYSSAMHMCTHTCTDSTYMIVYVLSPPFSWGVSKGAFKKCTQQFWPLRYFFPMGKVILYLRPLLRQKPCPGRFTFSHRLSSRNVAAIGHKSRSCNFNWRSHAA